MCAIYLIYKNNWLKYSSGATFLVVYSWHLSFWHDEHSGYSVPDGFCWCNQVGMD